MTVLVSVKINDGVVMATDSASSFANGMIYNSLRKIVHLREDLPVAVMITGAGGIGNESVATLLKDLGQRFTGIVPERHDWKIDANDYDIERIAVRLRQFLFEEKAVPHGATTWTKVRVCGYSALRLMMR